MNIDKGRIINDFIEPNKFQYAVPVYQRNYEWSEDQCIRLFQDIIQAYKRETSHFCGSVVYKLLSEEHGIHYYIIIDGQQRLTTVYLMLKALFDCSNTEKEKELISDTMFNKDKWDEFGIDKASKLKLKPIKSDNNQLFLLMDGKLEEMDRNSGICQNYLLFRNLIQKEIENGLYIKDIYKGIEQLTCAKIKLDEEDNAQEIFERINSTGLPLSLEDKIRNYVLMTDVNQDKLYEDYWLRAETLVRKEKMTAFFMDYINMKNDSFTTERDAYDNFKKIYTKESYNNETMLQEILHYARFYHAFLYGDVKYNHKINQLLKDLQKLKQTTVFLFLFHVFDDYEDGIIKENDIEQVLEFLLNYSIRRLICEVGSNSLRGLYKSLYSRVFTREENKDYYYDAIVSFFIQLTSNDRIPDDEDFTNSLKYNNLYKKNALCKYLLLSIENSGKEKLLSDNLTIEHVLPRNRSLPRAWQKMLGDEWVDIQIKYLNTLGNLTLTGFNSELGDRSFEEKKGILQNAKTKAVVLYNNILDKEVWDKNAIEERARELIQLIYALFPITQPEHKVSFADPRFKEYTCENPNEATSKIPNYYILEGERVIVHTFIDMQRTIISRLYEQDKEIIEDMARNNEQPVSWSQRVLFSYDANQVSSPKKIEGTSIYMSNSGFSASHVLYNIKALLDRYGIDDFVYSARSNDETN